MKRGGAALKKRLASLWLEGGDWGAQNSEVNIFFWGKIYEIRWSSSLKKTRLKTGEFEAG